MPFECTVHMCIQKHAFIPTVATEYSRDPSLLMYIFQIYLYMRNLPINILPLINHMIVQISWCWVHAMF